MNGVCRSKVSRSEHRGGTSVEIALIRAIELLNSVNERRGMIVNG